MHIGIETFTCRGARLKGFLYLYVNFNQDLIIFLFVDDSLRKTNQIFFSTNMVEATLVYICVNMCDVYSVTSRHFITEPS